MGVGGGMVVVGAGVGGGGAGNLINNEDNYANKRNLSFTKTRLLKCFENVTFKNWKFSDKKFDIFSYFCSKHRLWVHVRTAEFPQFMFLSRNMKNNIYPCKPQFYSIKVGFKGLKIIYE